MEFRKNALMTAIYSCFDKDGNVDVEAQKKLANVLIEKGIEGFYAGGATGEGFSMGTAERKQVIKAVCEAADHRVPVIAYVGCNDTNSAIELAKWAEQCGADAISSVPPYIGGYEYREVLNYYRTLAASVKIPLIVYANTYTYTLSFDQVCEILNLPNTIGLKYTAYDHYTLRMLTEAMPDKIFFSGADEMFGSALIAGVDGIIGSTYNFAPELFLDLRNAFEKGDMKEFTRLSLAGTKMVDIFIRNDYTANMKNILKILGYGQGYMRHPFMLASEESFKKCIAELREFKAKYNINNVGFLNDILEICK